MKKVVLVLGLITMGLSSVAQVEDFKSYHSSYESLDYEVWIDGNKTLYVNTGSEEKGEGVQYLVIVKSKIEMYLKQFNEAKSKFIEWKELAIVNGVNKLYKTISINPKYKRKSDIKARFKLYDEMKRDNNVSLHYRFWIYEDSTGEPIYNMIIRSGKYIAESNQFMEHEGSQIVLTGIEEIDSFIDIFDIETIESTDFKGDIFK